MGPAILLHYRGCHLHPAQCCLTQANYLIDRDLFQSSFHLSASICLLTPAKQVEGLWQDRRTQDSQFLLERTPLIPSLVTHDGDRTVLNVGTIFSGSLIQARYVLRYTEALLLEAVHFLSVDLR
jgi:hypothetical protein